MARPRIFLSSTYFDLKSIREELDRFISTLGYEPIRHELGHVSYGKDEPPESYAYREVEFSDILVSIIGSKFGTGSTHGNYSISQTELKRAYDLNKQVYIFIDEAVHAEFKFYQSNKNLPDVKYTAVTDIKIYTFIEEIYALPHGNPIFSFRTGGDIVALLRDQWAGLFQRLLTQETSRSQTALTEQLKQSLQTVDRLVKFLQQNHDNDRAGLQEIIFSNHPAFARLRALTKNKYRLYFSNLTELDDWLISAKNYTRIPDTHEDRNYIWMRDANTYQLRKQSISSYQVISFNKALFDEQGRLKPLSQGEWNDDWISLEITDEKPDRFPDDDIPF